MIQSQKIQACAHILEEELRWFYAFCHARGNVAEAFEDRLPSTRVEDYVDPGIFLDLPVQDYGGSTPYELFMKRLQEEIRLHYHDEMAVQMHAAERIILLLSLIPHLSPKLLHYLRELELSIQKIMNVTQASGSTFLPSGETALYILAGDNLQLRLMFQNIFAPQHLFAREGILSLGKVPKSLPPSYAPIEISEAYLHLFTTGEDYEPQMSQDFPAHRLTTTQDWDDLVVPISTHNRIQELLDWIAHYDQLEKHQEFGKERKGYRCLLVGEPGTGKTMLGRLLSQETSRPVYRLALDKIVSKYVGETTKNISKVFQTARNRDWILFCDEGDALFSKRSPKVQSAQDTYVNQDISYLLQEIEDYPGIIIVATNYSNNMDKAFQRRFDTRIVFHKPDQEELERLWQKALSVFQLDADIDLKFVAETHKNKVTGAQVSKVKHYLGMKAIKQGSWELSLGEFSQALHYMGLDVPDFEERKKRMKHYQNLNSFS